MTLTPDRDDWGRLLNQLDDPAVGVLAEALADETSADVVEAYDVVEAAVGEGELVEEDTGAALPVVRLPETDGTAQTPDRDPRGAVSEAGDPRGETGEIGIANGEAHLSGEIFYPEGVTELDVWVTWILDGVGRKRPVAPWQNGHAYPAKWSSDLDEEDRPQTNYETASRWAAFNLADAGLALPDDARSDELKLGIILPHDRADDPEDRLALIDWDDVRDPETGAIHPVAADFINRYGGYVEISTSGEGLHQFVEGGLRKRGKFIAPIDDEPFVGDDEPQIEIYDGSRHVATTGRHVAGTGRDVIEGQEMIDELVTEYASAEVDAGHRVYDPETGPSVGETQTDGDTSVDVPDPETVDYSGPTVEEYRSTKPDDRSFTYHVAVEAFYRGAGNAGGFAGIQNWRLEGFAAALGERDGLDAERVKADLNGRYLDDTDVTQRCVHRTPERIDYGFNRAASGRLEPPSVTTLVEYGVLPPAFDTERFAGGHYSVETCEPPAYDPEAFDRRERWDAFQGDRYDAVLDHHGVSVWNDPAGTGKTTNAALAALQRDRNVAMLFDKHEKAREVQTDDALPDWFNPYHLKGAEQKRHTRCMDADHAGETCSEHGHTENCPSMCPVKDLDSDHEMRRRYDAVAREVGDVKAHLLFAEILPGHDDDGRCDWVDQFEEVEAADHVVGVHEYQRLKTVRDGRDVIVDESPSSLRETTHVDIEGLVRTASALADLADVLPRDDATHHTARAFASFVDDLVDAVTGGATLADLDAPGVIWNAYESYDDTAGNYVEREEPTEEWHTAEALAQLKVIYAETILNRIKREEWDGTPVGLDAVITAAGDAGLSSDAVRTAVAAPTVLDSCPWCGSPLKSHNGARVCGSDTCDWSEHEHTITRRRGERARADAYLDDEPAGVRFEQLPLTSDLPTDPLILDATATPERAAHFYGANPDAVDVSGDGDLRANMRVTQVLDGQYHATTVAESDTARERIQTTIDKAGEIHEKPLFVLKKGLRGLFDFPAHAEILHYHAARGLNRNDCDAVVCIGAPHPNVPDLEREAALLAQGTDTRIGGAEHSTRRDVPNPPVYRQLNFEDDEGRGRAVPTKHYTGLVGDLFRETREKEIQQAIHRARPLLAEETVDVYLLTNVPTDVRVDTVCSFEELAEPLQALLPIRDGALELLGAVERVAAGDGPDGFRAEQLVEATADGVVSHKVAEYHRIARLAGLDVTERTVRNYIDDLEAVGLLEAEAYEQRAGVSYTADRSTLKSALSILSNNAGFKVAARRRLRSNIDKADSVTEWLGWAQAVFGLGGDRCDLDPPPGPTG